MLKFIRTLSLFAIMLFLVADTATGQKRADDANRRSKNGDTKQTIGSTNIRVTYGSPSVRGRKVFGELEKYGKVWRAGSDEATTITFSKDVKINGESLAAGTYSFFLIPMEDEPWTAIFNNVPEQWGAFDYDKKEDALRVMTKPMTGEHQETVLYTFEDVSDKEGTLVMHWGTTKVPLQITTM